MNNKIYVMKKILLITLALTAVAGCTKGIKPDSEEETLSKDFTHTGCSPDTRSSITNDPSLLTIKYEDGDLRVSLTNAELNCAFKERGLKCKANIEGNVIHYDVVYERDEEMIANCFCLVEKMTSAVSGLEKGKDYILQFSVPDFGLKPITFTFNEDLYKIFDLKTLLRIICIFDV